MGLAKLVTSMRIERRDTAYLVLERQLDSFVLRLSLLSQHRKCLSGCKDICYVAEVDDSDNLLGSHVGY